MRFSEHLTRSKNLEDVDGRERTATYIYIYLHVVLYPPDYRGRERRAGAEAPRYSQVKDKEPRDIKKRG